MAERTPEPTADVATPVAADAPAAAPEAKSDRADEPEGEADTAVAKNSNGESCMIQLAGDASPGKQVARGCAVA